MRKMTAFLLLFLLAASAAACTQKAPGTIAVTDAWARPGQKGGNSAIYFVIDNPQQEADTLLEAKTDAAMMVQLHRTETDSAGNSAMVHQESVPVPGGEKVSFEPGGLHVMLMQLNADLTAGQTLPVTLRFENAGEIEIQAEVREP